MRQLRLKRVEPLNWQIPGVCRQHIDRHGSLRGHLRVGQRAVRRAAELLNAWKLRGFLGG
jgi:hypothetical protein